MNDWIGQINREQARAIAIRAIGAGLVAVLGVIASDAPLYFSATTPAGVIIGVVIYKLKSYLASGTNPPGDK